MSEAKPSVDRGPDARGQHQKRRPEGGKGIPGVPPLMIAGRELRSRLILGTGGFVNHELLAGALAASGAELVTVALRRARPGARAARSSTCSRRHGVDVLPNTAGCYTARDAVITAQLAREAFETDWIKLEVIGDDRTLLPDAVELLRPPRSWSTTVSSCSRTRPTTRSSPAASRTSAARR